MKLVLVRHCEVLEGYQGKYNGHIDIPLSQKGFQDAKELGGKLSKEHFDAIYCSDLLRCKQTLAQFNLAQDVIYTDQLREKYWGKYEGMEFEEIEASGIKYTSFSKWIKDLGGESLEDFQKRIKNFLFQLPQNEKDTILVVTHSGVIKTILGLQNNYDLEQSFSITLEYGSILEFYL